MRHPVAVFAAALLVTIGAVIAVVQVDSLMDRNARFEQHRRMAMSPLVVESTGGADRLRIDEIEVGPIPQGIGHPLPTRAVGLMVPVAGDDGGPGWRHQWPGVYFEARFEGDSVAMAFDDGPRNRYRIALDGGAGPVVVLSASGRHGLRLSGLGPGQHEVRVDRISESQSGAGTFLGFFVASGGDARPPPPARARAIEFIGDSDSVGLGNRSERRNCTGEEVFLLTDTQESFGPRVARHLGADYQLNAISGITLVRDAGRAEGGRTMVSLHGRPLLDGAAPVSPTGWAPDVIVVALGSNDFSSDLAPSEAWSDLAAFRDDFARHYVRFLLELRRRHPRAFLLALAWEEYGSDYLSAHGDALAELRARGETRLDLVVLPPMRKAGCLWHPDLADHEAIAAALIRYVEARPGIWID